jgi:NAD(P)-dependent dehydrogenase (short-subunit alcohol dehydrogenase family)
LEKTAITSKNTMTNKRVLITGGNRGIGFAIAQGLLAQGYEIIITARSLENAQAAAAKLSGKVTPLQLEVTDDNSIHQAIQQIDTLDVLINNAGIYPDEGVTILTADRAFMTHTLDTNTLGPLHLTQACIPLLEKSPDARVINLSSGYGEINSLAADVPSYCLSKLALNSVTIMLAQALKSKNIMVNAMCPGWVRTDMGGASAPRSPEQGADTAIWLATEASRHETGKFWRDRVAVAL